MYWPKKLTASLIALMMAIPSGVTKVLAEEVVEEPIEDEIVEVVEEEVAEEEVVEIEEEAVEVEEAAEIEVVEEEAIIEEAGEEVTADDEVVADEDPYADVEAGVTYEPNTKFPKTDAKWQVTFTYKGEAESVALTGAFQYWTQKDMANFNDLDARALMAVKTPYEYVEGMVQTGYNPIGDAVSIDLEEVADNVWQVVVPLHSGEYYYDYVVDGKTIQDPANPSVKNPANGHDSGHSLIWIGEYGVDTDVLAGQEYTLPRADKKGTYEFVPYIAASGNTSYVTVYLPYGYDESKTYKTLYISHGGGGNEVEWHFIGAVDNIFDNLIAEGLVDETIVVSPTFSGVGDYTTNLIDHIIPLIEEKYSVSTDARDRAMAGLSAGSGRSQQVYRNAAGKIGYFGFWSAAGNYDPSTIPNGDYPTIVLGAGPFDTLAYGGYAAQCARFDAAGIPYHYEEYHGAHDWGVWREALTSLAINYLWKDEKLPNPETVPLGDIPFELEAQVYDWGEGINKVTIDLNEQGLDLDYINKGSFKVVANGTYVNNRGVEMVAYEGIEREIEAFEIEDGIVTLDLATPYGAAGVGTLIYTGGRNLLVSMDYEVSFVGDVTLEDGTTVDPRQYTFVQQGDFSDPEVDAYEYGNTDGLPWRLFTPANADDGEKHALIVWNHGAGESGTANEAQIRANRGALGFDTDEAQEIFGGAYVLAAETASGWNAADAQKLYDTIQNLIAEYPIDPDKVHVSGCSMGGGGTVRMATTYPEVWASVVPVCAAANANTYPDQLLLDTMGFQNVFFIHAANDTTVRPAGSSVRMHDLLPNSEFAYFENVLVDGIDYPGHWSWIYLGRNEAFAEDGRSVWQWMADQTRPLSYDDYEAGVVYEENTDYPDTDAKWQATFTYKGEADEVILTGAFQYWTEEDAANYVAGNTEDMVVKTPYEYKEGMMQTGYNPLGDMVEIVLEEVAHNVWQVTVPLVSGEYYYDYTVDGVTMQDPANRSVANPANGHDSGHSLIWIGEYGETDMLKGQEYVLPRNDKKGTYEFVPYIAASGNTSYVTVYLPYDYDESKTYKTLYISHGGGGNEVEWHFIGAVDNIFDNLLAEGLVDDTIVVSPTFSGVGDYTTNLLENIIPVIEKKYSVSTDARDRAMCGLSAGSSRSQQVFQKAAGEFGYFGFWSGAGNYNVDAIANKDYPTILMGPGYFDFAYNGYAGLKSRFDAAGVNYDYVEFRGAHDWGVWREALTLFAKDYLWKDTEKLPNPGQVNLGDIPFELEAQVYDWGEGIYKVTVDLNDQGIDLGYLNKGSFKVVANGTYVNNRGQVMTAYEGVERKINSVKIEDGIATIELDTPFGGEGVGTLIYTGGRNLLIAMDYDVSFVGDITLEDGTTVDPRQYTFAQQGDFVDPEVDAYEYGDTAGLPWRLFVPENYDDGEAHPLLLWLHGAGESGNANEAQIRANRGALGWDTDEAQEIFGGAFVLAPETQSGWNAADVAKVMDTIANLSEEYNIDQDRLHVAGCSMGGGGTVRIATTYPTAWASVVPICAAANANTYPDQLLLDTMGFQNVFFIHAENDTTVRPAGSSIRMHDVLPNSEFNLYPNVLVDGIDYPGHWSWIYFGRNEATAADGRSVWQWEADARRPLSYDDYEAGIEIADNTDFPESEANYQATFTYKGEAEDVVITGAFQYWTRRDAEDYKNGNTDRLRVKTPYEYKEGMIQTGYNPLGDMVELVLEEVAKDVWQVTVPLHAGEYYYDYVVDGKTMQDPANRSVANPANGHDSGHSLMWVGEYGDDNTLADQEYVLPRSDKKGTYEFVPYTAASGNTSYVTVYLPYGYDESKTYKTVYISHGAGGNEVEWHFIGAADNIFDNLIAEGLVDETIVVSPTFSGVGDYTTNLIDHIIPVIEEKYSVSKDARDRAMCGLSAGSSRSQQVYQRAAGKFGYFGFWSAASNFNVNAVKDKNYPTLMLGAGPFDFAYNGYAGLRQRLEAAGVDYEWYEMDGAHDWGVWRQSLTLFAKDILWKDADKPANPAEGYEPGVVVTPNPDEESNSGNIATFTFKTDEDYEKITVFGGFQFFTAEDGDNYLAGKTDGIKGKDAFEAAAAEEVMYPYGYSPVDDPAQFEYELTEVTDGVYQVSLPLPSDQYFYAYNVYKDGKATKVEDPANPYTLNPVNGNNSGWCVFYAGEPETALENMDLTFPRDDEQVGTYEYVPYTNVRGQDTSVVVYLPYNYDPANKYPTLYISHGGGGNEMDWPTVGAVKNIFDNAIANGDVEPTIVVSMNNTELGWNYGQILTNLTDILFPMMEEKYNASPDARDRAFSGLSMGGLTTTYLYQNAADKFGYFGIWSATQVFDVSKVPFNDYPTVMLGAGDMDFGNGAYPGLIARAAEAGFDWSDDMYYVHDGHNWYAWPQLLEIFAKDYLWDDDKPANAGDAIEPGVVVTPNPDEESNSGNIATFTFKTDEDYEKVTVFGGFQFFTAEDGDRYLAGDSEGIKGKDAFEAAAAEEVMYPYGYSPVDDPAQFEYELKEVTDGVYQVSLPLPSDQYFYAYNVYKDGKATKVQDPANPWTLNPVNGNNSGWCVFYAGEPETALENMDLTFPRDDEQVGTYEYVPYTNVRGQESSIVVYLPYGYDKANKYPTLYISHGGGGNEMDWPTVGAVKNIFDNAIANGDVEPTIVVSMNNTQLGWNYGQILTNLTDILFPMMEKEYNASPDARDRAFSGLSMGGLTTTYLYQNAADKFGYLGIWSATQVFDVSKVYFNDYPTVMLGAGDMDFGNGAYPGLIAKAAEAGFDWSDDMYYVHDGHNWYAWPQLLEIFAKDYLWSDADKPANAPEPDTSDYTPGVVYEENTDFPDTDAKWQATFTYKGEGSNVAITGAFQYWTREDMENYKNGKTEGLVVKTPFEYKEGMVQTGYNPLGDMVSIKLENVAYKTWQVTVPLASGEYYYDYVIDGVTMQDPANRSVANPANGNDSGHSLIWIGEYGETDMLEGQEYVLPRNDKKGTYEFVPYIAASGATSYLTVYKPYGYDESKEYKTLYISHGAGGNEVEWHFIGATDNIFDNLIAEGLVDETIVVSTNAYGSGNYVTNLWEKVVPLVEKLYSVSKKPEDRAMAGLSMGSGYAQNVYRAHAGDFGYFGFWSAASNYDVSAIPNNKFPTVMMGAGPFDFAYNGYAGLKQRFDAAGVGYKWYEFNGAHDWGVWRAAVTAFAKDILWKENKGFKFDDVQDPDKYYYDPVYWAYNHDPQITTGTSATTFSPNEEVTRGQFVTFLYRAAGEPDVDVSDLPFTDVAADKFYAKAVAWAVENNITTGTTPTTFSPNDKVTRAQIVTFLYRFAGEPEVSGDMPFTDVKAGKYFYEPVLWAYQNNITTGTAEDKFSPNLNCTRGQAVTFLYRVCE